MASLNKVQIIGNLGRDPETRYMPSGDAMTSITVATTENWKDKATGEKRADRMASHYFFRQTGRNRWSISEKRFASLCGRQSSHA